jgi:DNA-binding NtrC family response regulator
MENNYYKLLNFVSKLSQPKLKDAALETLSNRDENHGDSVLEIYETGIDNAEAVIAIEARRVLKEIAMSEMADITKMIKETQKTILSEQDIITKAFEATGGNVSRMNEMTGIPVRTIYNRLDKYNLDRRNYNFNAN